MSQGQPSTQVPSEFAPSEGGEETTSANAMLVSAYLALWVVLMLFIAASWRRQRATSKRLDEVEAALNAQPRP